MALQKLLYDVLGEHNIVKIIYDYYNYEFEGKLLYKIREEDYINCVASITVDLCVYATGNLLKILNLKTGAIISILIGHRNGITSLIVLPDLRIVSGAYDGELKIWNMYQNTPLIELTSRIPRAWYDAQPPIHHPSYIRSNGAITHLSYITPNRIVTGSSSGIMNIWDLNIKSCMILSGHSDSVTYLGIIAEKYIISCSDDYTVKIWKPDIEDCLITIKYDSIITAATILSENVFVIGDLNGSIRCYFLLIDNQEKSVKLTREIINTGKHVSCLTKISNEQIICGYTTDGVTKLQTINLLNGIIETEFIGHDGISPKFIALSSNGQIVLASRNNIIDIWNQNSGVCKHTIYNVDKHQIFVFKVLSGDYICCGCKDKCLKIWQ